MFYNHYDVQPAEPFDLWDDPPFSGVRKRNKIFGRGATDDKGELITRINALKHSKISRRCSMQHKICN